MKFPVGAACAADNFDVIKASMGLIRHSSPCRREPFSDPPLDSQQTLITGLHATACASLVSLFVAGSCTCYIQIPLPLKRASKAQQSGLPFMPCTHLLFLCLHADL